MIVPRPSFQTRISRLFALAFTGTGFSCAEMARPMERSARMPTKATVNEAVRKAAAASTAMAETMTNNARTFCMFKPFFTGKDGPCSLLLQEAFPDAVLRTAKKIVTNLR